MNLHRGTHSEQCVEIGGGPGHDKCVCFCHHNLPTEHTADLHREAKRPMSLCNCRWTPKRFATDTLHFRGFPGCKYEDRKR